MKTRLSTLLSLLMVVSAATVQAKPARVDDLGLEATVTEAQLRFRRALDLYREGDFDAARAELRRAYDASPNYRVLYNLGQVEVELRDYAAALATFRKYLQDGGDRIAPARRAQVAADVQKLESRVAAITIRANLPEVEVAIDDVPAGVTPLRAPVIVSAGRRKVALSRAGYRTETHWIDAAGGDRPTIDFELRKIAVWPPADLPRAEPAVADRAPAQPARLLEPASVPWIGWVATGTLAAGAAFTGALALDAAGRLREARATLGAERVELDDRKRRVDQLALATDVLIGTAVVAGAVSLYFTLSAKPGEERNAARVSVGLPGIALSGVF